MRTIIRAIALVAFLGVAAYGVAQMTFNSTAFAGPDDSTREVGGPRCPPGC